MMKKFFNILNILWNNLFKLKKYDEIVCLHFNTRPNNFIMTKRYSKWYLEPRCLAVKKGMMRWMKNIHSETDSPLRPAYWRKGLLRTGAEHGFYQRIGQFRFYFCLLQKMIDSATIHAEPFANKTRIIQRSIERTEKWRRFLYFRRPWFNKSNHLKPQYEKISFYEFSCRHIVHLVISTLNT